MRPIRHPLSTLFQLSAMIGEIDIFGVFVPAVLVLMLIAYLINLVIRTVLARVGFYRLRLASLHLRSRHLCAGAGPCRCRFAQTNNVKKTWFSVGQILLTLIVVVVAAFVLWKLVAYYMFAPWTRDGHVRADVIQVAPDISGLISSVEVVDNQQVKQGQVLFVIDQARYTLALRQAQATAQQRRATLDQARREDARNRKLGNLVARRSRRKKAARVSKQAKPRSPTRTSRSIPRS